MPKLLDSFITWMCLRKVESSKVIGHRGKEACEQRRENKKKQNKRKTTPGVQDLFPQTIYSCTKNQCKT